MHVSPDAPTETRPSLLPKLAIKPWVTAPPKAIALSNAFVVDPAAGSLLNGKRTVMIRRGVVVSVEPTGTSLSAPDVTTIDVNGAYICPGLIDCHVHVAAVPGVKSMADLARVPAQTAALRMTYVLKEMLLRGFTTVRDTGGASRALAQALSEGLIAGPRLIQCGHALSQTGGHGDSFESGTPGCCGGHSGPLARVADGVPDVLRATREELKGGADFIKIMVGGGVASDTDTIESLQYTAEEIRAITTTCRQMGPKLVTAHAYTIAAIRHAVDNGVGGIEHGNLLDVATAQMMAERGIYLTPTLACYGIMVRAPFEDFLPPDGQRKNEQVRRQGLTALKIAHEVGVTICYGSDLLGSMHALQAEEFTVRAGVLPAPAVLRHATTNAAKMIGMEGVLGCIAPGAHADLLVLNANPLENVTVLDWPEHHLMGVVQGGRVITSTIPALAALCGEAAYR